MRSEKRRGQVNGARWEPRCWKLKRTVTEESGGWSKKGHKEGRGEGKRWKRETWLSGASSPILPGTKQTRNSSFFFKVQQKGRRQQPFSTLFQAAFSPFSPQGQIRDLFPLATGALICGSQRFAHSITFYTSFHSRFFFFFLSRFSFSRIIFS